MGHPPGRPSPIQPIQVAGCSSASQIDCAACGEEARRGQTGQLLAKIKDKIERQASNRGSRRSSMLGRLKLPVHDEWAPQIMTKHSYSVANRVLDITGADSTSACAMVFHSLCSMRKPSFWWISSPCRRKVK